MGIALLGGLALLGERILSKAPGRTISAVCPVLIERSLRMKPLAQSVSNRASLIWLWIARAFQLGLCSQHSGPESPGPALDRKSSPTPVSRTEISCAVSAPIRHRIPAAATHAMAGRARLPARRSGADPTPNRHTVGDHYRCAGALNPSRSAGLHPNLDEPGRCEPSPSCQARADTAHSYGQSRRDNADTRAPCVVRHKGHGLITMLRRL